MEEEWEEDERGEGGGEGADILSTNWAASGDPFIAIGAIVDAFVSGIL